MALGISCRLLSHSLQNIYHRQWSAWDGSSPFILASAVSRSARFFLVAALVSKFGEPMKEKIDKHFNLLALVFGLLLVGGFLALKLLR